MSPVFEPPPVVSSGLYDNFVLNPVEFTPELPEVDLRDGGIQIGPGAPNLGEATVNVERVKRLIGEGVTGRQLGTVECEIPLLPGIDRYISQAASYEPLEAFVGDVQRGKIRWIRHDFKEVGGYSGSLATFVDNASLPKPFGGEVAELTLRLSHHPIWYATTEILAGEASGTNVRHLEMELAELLGTAPGLIRLVVKNEGAEDWRGCMVAIECDSFSSAATAKPSYEAKELTPKGGAEVKTVSGAEVVKCPPLTAGWQTVLRSTIAGAGEMTHVGPRRMVLRMEDRGAVLDDAQWKLEWRQLGAARWIQTISGSTPIVASLPVRFGFQLLDLGEVRPEKAVTGNQRWEFRLQARSLTGSGKQPLIRDVYPMTIEQWQKFFDQSDDPVDGEPILTPASITDGGAETGKTVTWTIGGGTATATFAAATKTHNLLLESLGFAVPASAILSVTGQAAITVEGEGTIKVSMGVLVAGKPVGTFFGIKRSAPFVVDLEDSWLQEALAEMGVTSSIVNTTGFGLYVFVEQESAKAATVKVAAPKLAVAYAESAGENRICFAGRSLELSDSGSRRQHVTDEVWGELIPEGLDLQAPVPGQATQSLRMLLVPSVGDFGSRPDSSAVKLSSKLFYRPAYLSAREAA